MRAEMRRKRVARQAAARGKAQFVGQDLNELFDVVDADDRVIGQATRRDVHARGLRHRAVHVFVQNRAHQIFLHQRSADKDTYPNRWNSSCAGHVAAGQAYDETVWRELAEELACTPEREPERILFVEARPETGEEFVWIYRAENEGPFVLAPEEIQRGDWFTVAEIDRWIAERPGDFADSFVFLWPRVRPFFTADGRL